MAEPAPDQSDAAARRAAQPEFDFDGRYRVERFDGTWYLRGPILAGSGVGMLIRGESPELLDKYRDLADLLNAAVDAERRR